MDFAKWIITLAFRIRANTARCASLCCRAATAAIAYQDIKEIPAKFVSNQLLRTVAAFVENLAHPLRYLLKIYCLLGSIFRKFTFFGALAGHLPLLSQYLLKIYCVLRSICRKFAFLILFSVDPLADDLYIPQFNGINSYIKFPCLENVRRGFSIEIWFSANSLNGVLLYNGQLHNRRGDFISVNLVNGHVQFRYDLGSGMANIT